MALDETSRFNTAWHAGLGEFFAGRYSAAARQLTEANRLLPEMPDVQRISAENAARVKTQPLLPWGRVGAALRRSAAWSATRRCSGCRWQRNRFRISPSEVARLLEGTEPPAILDVRETDRLRAQPGADPALAARHRWRISPTGGKRPDVDPNRMIVAYCT